MNLLLQPPYSRADWGCLTWVISLLYFLMMAFVFDPPRHDATIRITASLPVVYWTIGAFLLLRLQPGDWLSSHKRREEAALFWLLGFLAMVWHVGMAFHLLHGWSHAAAFAHTERTSGVGEGIFVNYAFVLLWGADVLWLLLHPASYARRPRWVGWPLHGFLAFVTFNATVIYGTGLARWLGIAAFTLLAVQWLRQSRK